VKLFYKITADLIFVTHLIIVLIVLFGWIWSSIWLLYAIVLIVTILSDFIFGYCIISKWEFNLRKKVNPAVDYDYTWSSFYTYKFTQNKLSKPFINISAKVFLIASLIFNLYFRF